MAFLFEELPRIRKFCTRNTFEVVLLRFEVNTEPDTREVEKCRDRRRTDDLNIRYPNELRHEERRRTHNRRHQLTACRRSGLYRACEVFVITELFHHRNGERTRAGNVRDRTARYRPHQTARKNGYLRRTTARPACNSVGDINEELTKTRDLQVDTEQNKQIDKRSRYTERNTEDTFRREEEMSDKLF